MRRGKIEIDNLSFQYGKDHEVLKNITYFSGEYVSIGLVGANGAGKSTLLKLLVGLLPGFQGNIRMDDLLVEKKNLAEIRRRTGYVFQDSDSQLFMSTVAEDIAFGPRNYGYSPEEVEERVARALEMTGIEYLKDRQTVRMSGGEKKLASIATILSLTPDIMLMDEPSTALDPRNRRNLVKILNGFDCLKVIASHDLDFILDTCERTILLSKGTIVCEGPTGEILSNQKLLEENGLELPLSMLRR